MKKGGPASLLEVVAGGKVVCGGGATATGGRRWKCSGGSLLGSRKRKN
jgi:hypothetical protein